MERRYFDGGAETRNFERQRLREEGERERRREGKKGRGVEMMANALGMSGMVSPGLCADARGSRGPRWRCKARASLPRPEEYRQQQVQKEKEQQQQRSFRDEGLERARIKGLGIRTAMRGDKSFVDSGMVLTNGVVDVRSDGERSFDTIRKEKLGKVQGSPFIRSLRESRIIPVQSGSEWESLLEVSERNDTLLVLAVAREGREAQTMLNAVTQLVGRSRGVTFATAIGEDCESFRDLMRTIGCRRPGILAFVRHGEAVAQLRVEEQGFATRALDLLTYHAPESGGAGAVHDISCVDELWAVLEEVSGTDRLVVAEVSTTSCGPCRAIHPKLVSLSQTLDNIYFLRLLADSNDPEVARFARRFNIRAFPSFLFFMEKTLIFSHAGARVQDLTANVVRLADYVPSVKLTDPDYGNSPSE